MALKVIIVGAGIGGLTAAIAVRQAGHSVQIFEKSKFAKEVGAALGLTPNGANVLKALGFSFERARAREITSWDIADGVSLKVLNSMDLKESAKQFGFQTYAVHRVDMHNELLRLAQEPTADGKEAVKLNLSSKVVDGSAAEGWIELEDGSKHHADLIIGADGIHSALRPLVVGSENVKTIPSGLSAFRFLVSTKKMNDDDALESLMKWKSTGAATLTDPTDPLPERHMMWYDCQDGEVQNFVGVHYSREIHNTEDDKPDYKSAMTEEFSAYHPDLKHVLSIADDVSCWPLNVHEPLASWKKEKMLLVGDAAHPMLPFGGQGSNQAIEDAGALWRVLDGVKDPQEISTRLDVFEEVRVKRASMIQTLSKVRVGREKDVEEELKKYAPTGAKLPGTFPERSFHAFSHNVIKATDMALQAAMKVEVSPITTEAVVPAAAQIEPASPVRVEKECVELNPTQTNSRANGIMERITQGPEEAKEDVRGIDETKESMMRTIEALTNMNQVLVATTHSLTVAVEALVLTNKAILAANDPQELKQREQDSVEAIVDEIQQAMANIRSLKDASNDQVLLAKTATSASIAA